VGRRQQSAPEQTAGMPGPGAGAAPALEELVERARSGDARALEDVVRAVKDDVFGLAVRMLWHPEDAEDASQEILMKVVTHLATWRGESAFRTWVYRVAANHLLNVRKSRVEREELTFSAFGAALAENLGDPPAPAADNPEQRLLEEEVKIGCTQGMLLCLDREHRVAYVLGEVFELRSEEAAYVAGVEPATFRKRLSRARERVRAFMSEHCGLVNDAVPCRCARRVEYAVSAGRVDPGRLLFAGRPETARRARLALPVVEQVEEMEGLHRVAGVFRSPPEYSAPERLVGAVRQLIESGRFTLLQ
jgi:RNA polymerase sigma factor (sigma-70 family)